MEFFFHSQILENDRNKENEAYEITNFADDEKPGPAATGMGGRKLSIGKSLEKKSSSATNKEPRKSFDKEDKEKLSSSTSGKLPALKGSTGSTSSSGTNEKGGDVLKTSGNLGGGKASLNKSTPKTVPPVDDVSTGSGKGQNKLMKDPKDEDRGGSGKGLNKLMNMGAPKADETAGPAATADKKKIITSPTPPSKPKPKK
jgi:hypothetical protein